MKRIIEFGHDPNHVGKALEWLVLEEEEETLFLLARRSVCCMPFDVEGNLWRTSLIRSWLNTAFYDQAFHPSEKSCIRRTMVQTWDCYGRFCDASEDDIFLLGMEELETFFPAQSSRRDTIAWWLRDAGSYDRAVMLVAEDGSFDVDAGSQNVWGIRPAMRIDKNYAELITPEIPVLEGQMRLFENRECFVDEDAKMETELDEILRELGMDPRGERREFRWLK